MKIPHVTEVWVNFTTQLGLFIKKWAENTFFHMWPRTIALKCPRVGVAAYLKDISTDNDKT